MKETKEGQLKAETPEGAFPYPSIEQDSGVGPYQTGLTLQEGLNQSLRLPGLKPLQKRNLRAPAKKQQTPTASYPHHLNRGVGKFK